MEKGRRRDFFLWRRAPRNRMRSFLSVLCQHLTTQHHRKPTKRSLTWKHKRTVSSRRLSYVMTLYLCTHPVSRVHVIGSGRV